MWRSWFAVFLVAVTGMTRAQQPRQIESRLVGGFGYGVEFSQLEQDSGARWHQLPGATESLDGGASFMWRDRLCLAAQASLTGNGIWFYQPGAGASATHLVFRAEGRVDWISPWTKGRDRQVYFGLGCGWSMQRRGHYEKVKDDFRIRADDYPQSTLYLAPEIGVLEFDDSDRIEIGLRYLLHLDRTPAGYGTLVHGSSGAHFTFTHDQLALVMRWHLGFPRKEHTPAEPIYYDKGPRELDSLQVVHAQRGTVVMRLWDNAEFDGDSVTVWLNNQPLVTGLPLTHRKTRLLIPLDYGINRLVVTAVNEGRVPPNTAQCRLRGVREHGFFLLRTSMKVDQIITIMRKWE